MWQWHLFLTKQATDRVVNERQSDTRPSLGRPLFNCADCQRDDTEESLLTAHFTVVCSVTWPLSRREAGGDLQSWTKVLRQIHKTNAFQLIMEFCIWMKTPFSSVVTSSPLKQCCKTLRGCLFVSNIEKGGRGGNLERGKRGEFTPRVKTLVIFVCLNNFCPWLWVWYKPLCLSHAYVRANKHTRKAVRSVPKQGHLQSRFYSKASSL